MQSVLRGKKITIAIIVIMLLIDITTTVIISSIYSAYGDTGQASYKIMQGIFRLILTGLLLFFLYKGHQWAKWIIAILALIAGGMSLFSVFNVFIILMAAIYIITGVLLIASKDIKHFMLYQRGELPTSVDESNNS
jgi:hypothetical protein